MHNSHVKRALCSELYLPKGDLEGKEAFVYSSSLGKETGN